MLSCVRPLETGLCHEVMPYGLLVFVIFAGVELGKGARRNYEAQPFAHCLSRFALAVEGRAAVLVARPLQVDRGDPFAAATGWKHSGDITRFASKEIADVRIHKDGVPKKTIASHLEWFYQLQFLRLIRPERR